MEGPPSLLAARHPEEELGCHFSHLGLVATVNLGELDDLRHLRDRLIHRAAGVLFLFFFEIRHTFVLRYAA